MTSSFSLYFRRLWLSPLLMQCVRALIVAAVAELLLYVIHARLRRALAPALQRDATADSVQRLERRRIVLGLPVALTRTVVYAVALLLILRIFHFRPEADVYPVALAMLVVTVVAARQALRDLFAGYLIHYDYLYKIGDEITVGQHSGMVSEIGLRYTRLRTREGHEIIVPNGQVGYLVRQAAARRRAETQPPPPTAPQADQTPPPDATLDVTLSPPENTEAS